MDNETPPSAPSAGSAPAVADDRQAQITDYLQAPRKKRKNYVILALPRRFDNNVTDAIVNFVRKTYPQLAISRPDNPQELTRQFGRNISLLVIDHNFMPDAEVFTLVKNLKEKRKNEKIPVIFLTKDQGGLVKAYHENLLKYQEADDYVIYRKDSTQKMLSRIKTGIDAKNKRKTRRYQVNFPVQFFHLEKDSYVDGRIVDISIHGAQIIGQDHLLFREGDQLKLSIPTSNYVLPEFGDFLKIAAKVQRVFIGGNHAAISFEYLSENQTIRLTKFVVALVTKEMAMSTRRLRVQAAATKRQE